MFDEAFTKLNLDQTALILDQIKDDLDGTVFDPIETIIMAIDVPFYPGYQFMEMSSTTQNPPIRRHLVYSPKKWIILDYTNQSIYELNKNVPIKLVGVNIADYIRFFFRFVKGRHGYFFIVESVDAIRWKDDPPPQARKAVGAMINPITLTSIGQGADEGVFYCTVNMMFKNALFKSDVHIKPDGQVNIINEEILIDDMPIIDDLFGQ